MNSREELIRLAEEMCEAACAAYSASEHCRNQEWVTHSEMRNIHAKADAKHAKFVSALDRILGPQEPVAWMRRDPWTVSPVSDMVHREQLYAAPPMQAAQQYVQHPQMMSQTKQNDLIGAGQQNMGESEVETVQGSAGNNPDTPRVESVQTGSRSQVAHPSTSQAAREDALQRLYEDVTTEDGFPKKPSIRALQRARAALAAKEGKDE